MNEDQLTELIGKYLSGEANESEKEQVEEWYASFDDSSIFFAGGNIEKIKASTARSLKVIKEKMAQQRAEEKPIIRTRKRLIGRIAAVAAVLILIAGTVYFLINKGPELQLSVAILPIKKDFKPGGNRAILTLGNGAEIELDSSRQGLLSTQGGTKVIKLNKGLLTYKFNRESRIKNRESRIQYNSITTPRGGQYEVILPDGSKVWLNAASSIRFPTVFRGKGRKVEITGEAYFEVAQKVNQPFEVSVKGMTVKVLGTHFNVMAYNDEKTIKTTLLEGSIRVSTNDKPRRSTILLPGEQAQMGSNGKIKKIKNIDTNKSIAWKKHLFWFENDDIQKIMKQLSRWYDVDIKIEGNIPDLFTGSMPRNLTFSKVFEVLQKTGSIHYKIQNKKVIVSP